jgi:hypothetical protein
MAEWDRKTSAAIAEKVRHKEVARVTWVVSLHQVSSRFCYSNAFDQPSILADIIKTIES